MVCCLVSLGWFVQLRIACGGQALFVGGGGVSDFRFVFGG